MKFSNLCRCAPRSVAGFNEKPYSLDKHACFSLAAVHDPICWRRRNYHPQCFPTGKALQSCQSQTHPTQDERQRCWPSRRNPRMDGCQGPSLLHAGRMVWKNKVLAMTSATSRHGSDGVLMGLRPTMKSRDGFLMGF
jgi:hypothetical protein